MKELETMRKTYASSLTEREKKLVHYSVELVKHDAKTGRKISHPDIIRTGKKLFPDIKKNLELQGYTVIILWHPEGKYNTPMFVETKEEVNDTAILEVKAQADAEIAEKDKEIARLKAELAKAKTESKGKGGKTEGKGKGGKTTKGGEETPKEA